MKGKNGPKESVNAKLLSHGYAKLIDDEPLPQEWTFMEQEQEKAMVKKGGIW